MHFLIVSFLSFAAALAPEAPGKKGLFIGIDQYQSQADLDTAVQDAKDMAVTMAAYGFDIHGGAPLLNPTDAEIYEALESFRASLAPDDVAFVYFGGHGIGYDGQNWLIPSNDENIKYLEQLQYRSISAETVAETLSEGNRPGPTIMMVDACRNRALPSRSDPARGNHFGAVPVSRRGGVLYAFAASPGELAGSSHPRRQNGLFTGMFLETLERNPGTRVDDLFRLVREEVRQVRPSQNAMLAEDISLNKLFALTPVTAERAPQSTALAALSTDGGERGMAANDLTAVPAAQADEISADGVDLALLEAPSLSDDALIGAYPPAAQTTRPMAPSVQAAVTVGGSAPTEPRDNPAPLGAVAVGTANALSGVASAATTPPAIAARSGSVVTASVVEALPTDGAAARPSGADPATAQTLPLDGEPTAIAANTAPPVFPEQAPVPAPVQLATVAPEPVLVATEEMAKANALPARRAPIAPTDLILPDLDVSYIETVGPDPMRSALPAPDSFTGCLRGDRPGTETVKIGFDVSDMGVPSAIEVLEASDPCYGRSALAAVAAWRYPPEFATESGEPRVGLSTVVSYSFGGP